MPDPNCDYKAALVFGGAENLSESADVAYIQEELTWIEGWLKTNKPLLGFCLGGQMLAQALGARVAPHPEGYHEVGYFEIHPAEESNGFLDQPMHMYQWHKEGFEVPDGATVLAHGRGHFPNQAFRYGDNVYGLQFHPEVDASVFSTWLDEVRDIHKKPGAHEPGKQLADAELHDAPAGQWLDGFLRNLLA